MFPRPRTMLWHQQVNCFSSHRQLGRIKHAQMWQNYSGQELGRKLVRASNLGLTNRLMGLSRGRLKQVTALITGHGHFRKHLRTLGIINDNSECRLCGNHEETAKHIILECERLGVRRRTLFGSTQPGDESDPCIGNKLLDLVKGTGVGLPI